MVDSSIHECGNVYDLHLQRLRPSAILLKRTVSPGRRCMYVVGCMTKVQSAVARLAHSIIRCLHDQNGKFRSLTGTPHLSYARQSCIRVQHWYLCACPVQFSHLIMAMPRVVSLLNAMGKCNERPFGHHSTFLLQQGGTLENEQPFMPRMSLFT